MLIIKLNSQTLRYIKKKRFHTNFDWVQIHGSCVYAAFVYTSLLMTPSERFLCFIGRVDIYGISQYIINNCLLGNEYALVQIGFNIRFILQPNLYYS